MADDQLDSSLDEAKDLPPVALQTNNRVLHVKFVSLYLFQSVIARDSSVVLIPDLLSVTEGVIEIF